eukprot:TRINITY_DN65566_c3_g3_i1.p1 TRINITY_DN65566_c3_g3~~TRINITY_DN65566_c3_g3_i1.p1  ORF type:complete len:262 (+),score=97.29 TRINITY_DN65566_c3_g3_i1:37-786(+)
MTTADEDVLAIAFLCVFPFFTFLGEKVFKPTVAGAGFATLGYGMFWATREVAGLSDSARLGLVLAAGVVGAVVVVSVYKAGVFLSGAVAGALLFNLAYQVVVTQTHVQHPSIEAHYIAVGLAAVVGGVLAVKWFKYAVRVMTAMIGSYMGVAGVSHFISRGNEKATDSLSPRVFFSHSESFQCQDDACYALLGAWGVLFVLGMMVQFHLGPSWRKSADADGSDDEDADAEYFRLSNPTTHGHHDEGFDY